MRRCGFTFVELLVVLGMLVVVIGIAIPVVWKLQENSRRKGTEKNLSEIGVAVHKATGDFKRMPPAFGVWGTGFGNQNGADIATTLFVHLLPYVGDKDAYDRGELSSRPLFLAPSDPTASYDAVLATSFVANSAVFPDARLFSAGCKDNRLCYKNLSPSMPNGTSCVIMFATGAMNAQAGAPKGVRDYSVFHRQGGGAFSSTTSVSVPQWSWDFRSENADPAKFQPSEPGAILVCTGDASTHRWKEGKPNGWLHGMSPNDGMKYDFETDTLIAPEIIGDF
jgi:type II secretory pathway pseudopilin PulG